MKTGTFLFSCPPCSCLSPDGVLAWCPVTGADSQVAQTGSLLYHRLATGGSADCPLAKRCCRLRLRCQGAHNVRGILSSTEGGGEGFATGRDERFD